MVSDEAEPVVQAALCRIRHPVDFEVSCGSSERLRGASDLPSLNESLRAQPDIVDEAHLLGGPADDGKTLTVAAGTVGVGLAPWFWPSISTVGVQISAWLGQAGAAVGSVGAAVGATARTLAPKLLGPVAYVLPNSFFSSGPHKTHDGVETFYDRGGGFIRLTHPDGREVTAVLHDDLFVTPAGEVVARLDVQSDAPVFLPGRLSPMTPVRPLPEDEVFRPGVPADLRGSKPLTHPGSLDHDESFVAHDGRFADEGLTVVEEPEARHHDAPRPSADDLISRSTEHGDEQQPTPDEIYRELLAKTGVAQSVPPGDYPAIEEMHRRSGNNLPITELPGGKAVVFEEARTVLDDANSERNLTLYLGDEGATLVASDRTASLSQSTGTFGHRLLGADQGEVNVTSSADSDDSLLRIRVRTAKELNAAFEAVGSPLRVTPSAGSRQNSITLHHSEESYARTLLERFEGHPQEVTEETARLLQGEYEAQGEGLRLHIVPNSGLAILYRETFSVADVEFFWGYYGATVVTDSGVGQVHNSSFADIARELFESPAGAVTLPTPDDARFARNAIRDALKWSRAKLRIKIGKDRRSVVLQLPKELSQAR